MTLLVDVCSGRAVADTLRSLGFDTAFVRDRNPAMSDLEILAWAVSERQLVVTSDKDFGELVFRSGLPHTGVLLLRLDAARTAEKVRVATDIFTRFRDRLPGRISVYQDGRLRIR